MFTIRSRTSRCAVELAIPCLALLLQTPESNTVHPNVNKPRYSRRAAAALILSPDPLGGALIGAAVELTRRVLPGMRERKWGRVLNVTSIAAKQPVDGLMLSNSVRSAVTGWARTLANEVASDGITVNSVLPGFTRTERVQELNAATAKREGIEPEEVQRRIEAQIPMRRIGKPHEFAALVAFLASERASYITAQSIAVDGGWIRSLL